MKRKFTPKFTPLYFVFKIILNTLFILFVVALITNYQTVLQKTWWMFFVPGLIILIRLYFKRKE